MPSAASAATSEPNPLLEVMEALSNHHGQVDIHLERLSLKLPFSGRAVELSGTVSVSVHLRELTEKERAAHVARQLKALSG